MSPRELWWLYETDVPDTGPRLSYQQQQELGALLDEALAKDGRE